MATKRLLEDTDNISDRLEGKRVRPSFTVSVIQILRNLLTCYPIPLVIKRAVEVERMKIAYRAFFREVMKDEMEQWFPHLASFREVVQEEMERGFLRLARLLQRSPQMLIEEPKSSSVLQLTFNNKPPSHPIFTGNIIKDDDGSPLQILLKETAIGARPTTVLPSSIKLEIVVLDGDFPYDDSENWSRSEFNRYVVKEREGKLLLIGTTVVTLKDRVVVIDELKFSDNSSWTRSGKFRIGVRVSSEQQQSLNIREAVSSPIKVKDRRGEDRMKHNPPLLNDEVWRLVNIGKNGNNHKKLVEMNIYTVQDFLKFLVTDSAEQLKKTLNMSKRKWEATINQAKTCPLGDDPYIHNDSHFCNDLNPICDARNILVDGSLETHQEHSMPIRQSVLEAYNYWDSLAEISITPQVETHQNEVFFGAGLMQINELMEEENWS